MGRGQLQVKDYGGAKEAKIYPQGYLQKTTHQFIKGSVGKGEEISKLGKPQHSVPADSNITSWGKGGGGRVLCFNRCSGKKRWWKELLKDQGVKVKVR